MSNLSQIIDKEIEQLNQETNSSLENKKEITNKQFLEGLVCHLNNFFVSVAPKNN